MREAIKSYKKLVLVCTNERTDGRECCAQKGSIDLHQKIKEAIKAVDPEIRVSRTGCLGNCASGVSVVIMPDNLWLGEVTEADIAEIVRLAISPLVK
ncbi:ferredoxin [Candidatus Uhrbacteria bacterium CG_4_9_14_3_um_filter_50_9]|uniref:Ferredoxin n=1 Tax=Candidatus Uhrbacteria bacterium CG_4_9_14_3_um_filter_50_9 TaxID=1975035 RepID=A0A2M7XDE1_9BACT|nr:MAG: ferredoxin [Candidatus Uhrbacteria bacterium CG_4_9_14_3_um_filter_50_9]